MSLEGPKRRVLGAVKEGAADPDGRFRKRNKGNRVEPARAKGEGVWTLIRPAQRNRGMERPMEGPIIK